MPCRPRSRKLVIVTIEFTGRRIVKLPFVTGMSSCRLINTSEMMSEKHIRNGVRNDVRNDVTACTSQSVREKVRNTESVPACAYS